MADPMERIVRNHNTGPPSEFVKKLYNMLEDKTHVDIVSWGKNLDTFVVRDATEFQSRILPKHFKHNNFASFVRQLNKYDFRKLRNPEKNGKQSWEFYHKNFRYDQKFNPDAIKRKSTTIRRGSTNSATIKGHDTVANSQAEIQTLRRTRDELLNKIKELLKCYHSLRYQLEALEQKVSVHEHLLNQIFCLSDDMGKHTCEHFNNQSLSHMKLDNNLIASISPLGNSAPNIGKNIQPSAEFRQASSSTFHNSNNLLPNPLEYSSRNLEAPRQKFDKSLHEKLKQPTLGQSDKSIDNRLEFLMESPSSFVSPSFATVKCEKISPSTSSVSGQFSPSSPQTSRLQSTSYTETESIRWTLFPVPQESHDPLAHAHTERPSVSSTMDFQILTDSATSNTLSTTASTSTINSLTVRGFTESQSITADKDSTDNIFSPLSSTIATSPNLSFPTDLYAQHNSVRSLSPSTGPSLIRVRGFSTESSAMEELHSDGQQQSPATEDCWFLSATQR
ncbi:uncharacterized protein VTP21DRAFT_7649 [Calcarisporiella thermophila]|uniref:uncharacterized protein n=1 Tax=Calcarisporiella thermophila TaxID=911321 RepID=UPI00374321F4